MLKKALVVVLALGALSPIQARASVVTSGTVTAIASPDGSSLCNELVCRRWEGTSPVTTVAAGEGVDAHWSGPDFRLTLDGVSVTSDLMPVIALVPEAFDGGARLRWTLGVDPVVTVERVVEVYEGIAGFHSRTTISSLVPLPLSGYTLDEIGTGPGLGTIHAFRAGADWREPDWAPQLSIGDTHTGDWRESRSAPGSIEGPGEWVSVALDEGGTVGIVAERRDYDSSRVAFDGVRAHAGVDLSHDVVYTGPFEESIHAENPAGGPARHRLVIPGRPLALEPAFTILAPDEDHQAWAYHEYLAGHRLVPYAREVTFNTNGVDANAISTGAKDDVNFARFKTLAAAAHELGVDTFVLDDGWQARSGDWCPDSPACPEPRWDEVDQRFAPRFPDESFAAVREVLAGDPEDPTDDIRLGLWMTPMEFHPSSAAFTTNPQWACAPVGHATGAVSYADDGGSYDAGIGVWNPVALGVHPDTGEPMRLIDYIEDRIRRAIDDWDVRYFKFDFLVWVDCGGVEPVDMYGYHDAFVDMLDRLQADYDGVAGPAVTFQVDETNDYRLFPFESIARGPSWFQNGKPESHELLHNLWSLSPWVPGSSLGQHAAGRPNECDPCGDDGIAKTLDELMAVALGSHITLWNEIDAAYTGAQRTQLRRWTDFYEANPSLGDFTFPLLDDPRAKGWTALQPWDVDAASGWLLAYRQLSADAERAIALRGLGGEPDGRAFNTTVVDPATGVETALGTFTASQLRTEGLPVGIADVWGYAIVRIEPA